MKCCIIGLGVFGRNLARCLSQLGADVLVVDRKDENISAIKDDLAQSRAAVVQIVSTNEAVMERRLAEIPPEEWNNLAIDLTPKDQVLDYLTGAFPIGAMEGSGHRTGTDIR